MDWLRLRAGLIRALWTVVFPAIGAGVAYLLQPGALEEFGVTDGTIALVIGGVLYGIKKIVWPDTVL